MSAKDFLNSLSVGVGEQVGGSRYQISGATAVFDKNAGVEIQVYGAERLPVVGLWVVNLFPDGHGDEPAQTSAQGKAQFDFGPASAYTPPASGPYRILLTDSASKDDERIVHYGAVLSDIIMGLGDVNGRHTYWSLQFVERTTPVVPPPVTIPTYHDPLRDSVRAAAWNRRGVAFNPDAALYKKAFAASLGYPLTQEYQFKDDAGILYVGQDFSGGTVYCRVGDYGNIKVNSWL